MIFQFKAVLTACIILLFISAAPCASHGQENTKKRTLPDAEAVEKSANETLKRLNHFTRRIGTFIETSRKLFANGECEVAFGHLELDPSNKTSAPFLWARLHSLGLCVGQNQNEAFSLYKMAANAPDSDAFKPLALAHLGTAYWTGTGTKQNKQKAASLFRRAVMLKSPDILRDLIEGHYERKTLFTVPFIDARWDYPAPLLKEIRRIEKISKNGPEEITRTALSIRHGKDGYIENPLLAWHWSRIAALKYVHPPGMFAFGIFTKDERIMDARGIPTEDRPKEISTGYEFIEHAAQEGHTPALPYVIEGLKWSANYPDKDVSFYYYLMCQKVAGQTYDEDLLKAVSSRLTVQKKEIIHHILGKTPYPATFPEPMSKDGN